MKHFAGQIAWQGTALDFTDEATLTLPSGEVHTIFRESRSSMVKVHNGPFFTGECKYFLLMPDGSKQEYETFDQLMMVGLKQPRLEE